jgi:hypothetical protein
MMPQFSKRSPQTWRVGKFAADRRMKFRAKILSNLRNRGVKEVLIAGGSGEKGVK